MKQVNISKGDSFIFKLGPESGLASLPGRLLEMYFYAVLRNYEECCSPLYSTLMEGFSARGIHTEKEKEENAGTHKKYRSLSSRIIVFR